MSSAITQGLNIRSGGLNAGGAAYGTGPFMDPARRKEMRRGQKMQSNRDLAGREGVAGILNLQNMLAGQSQALSGTAIPAYQQSVDYYRKLMQGGVAQQQALAGTSENIAGTWKGAQRGIAYNTPAGGVRETELADSRRQAAGAQAALYRDAPGQAAGALGQLGLGGAGQATLAGGQANAGFGNLLQYAGGPRYSPEEEGQQQKMQMFLGLMQMFMGGMGGGGGGGFGGVR